MKVAVVIGRFQPFHSGHEHLFSTAIQNNDLTIIVLGSANRSRSIKNPFTVAERKHMILDWYVTQPFYTNTRMPEFVESPDNLYKEWTWKSEIVRRVNDCLPTGAECNIRLYGHEKDDSSYYLKEFPEWDFVSVENYMDVDATSFRTSYFEDGIVSGYFLPDSSRDFMIDFKKTKEYEDLKEDWEFFKWEKKAFSDYPFPETLNFMCSDAVVNCQGHLLMIKRKAAPGKNLWALPGGFKNNDETFEQCCIRELKEETNLRVPEKVLTGSIKNINMFDDPRRSIGIKRVSMAYYIEVLPDYDGNMPAVRPDSDAFEAKWISLDEVLSMNLFEDHLDIVRWFV